MVSIKRVLLPTIGLSICLTSVARSEVDKMVIHLNGGGEAKEFVISDKTKITFDGNSMSVSQDVGDSFMVSVADVDKISFDLQSSSVEEIETSLGDNVSVVVNGGCVTIGSTDGVSAVNYGAYSTSGQTVVSGVTDREVTIDFTAMQRGVYIIKANSKTIKFINK